jgi:hypothetical protein
MNYGFGEASFEYFESCNFSYRCIRVYVWLKDDKHVIWMWIWLILKNINSFASLTRQQTSYSGSVGWYFRYQSIHIQITYTSRRLDIFVQLSSGFIASANFTDWFCKNTELCGTSYWRCIAYDTTEQTATRWVRSLKWDFIHVRAAQGRLNSIKDSLAKQCSGAIPTQPLTGIKM